MPYPALCLLYATGRAVHLSFDWCGKMRRTVALLSRELESKSYFVASRDKKHTLHLRRVSIRFGCIDRSYCTTIGLYLICSCTTACRLHKIRAGGEAQTGEAAKPVCLLFHGAIENGRIYYSKSNK